MLVLFGTLKKEDCTNRLRRCSPTTEQPNRCKSNARHLHFITAGRERTTEQMEEQTKATKWQGTADLNNPLPVSTEDFIKAFGYSGAENVYCRAFADKGNAPAANRQAPARSFASMLPELHRLNADNCGIFFAVNGGNTDAETKSLNKCRAQFMEIDTLPLEEQLQKIKQFALEPSIIVKTRKSLHTYWLLSGGSIKNFRKVQLQLVAHFGSDPALQNESRVMRLPGFNHCKGEPVPVQVIKFDPGIKNTQQELANLLPPPAKKERTELPELVDDAPSLYEQMQSRHNAMMKFLGNARQSGINLQELRQMAHAYNAVLLETTGEAINEKPLEKIINDVCKYQYADLQRIIKTEQAKQDFAEQQQPEKKADFCNDFYELVKTDAYKPYPTECDFFDDMLNGGIIRQSLLLLLAAPATGKTTFCQQIAEEMARHGKKVLYFNLEMSREQMLAKAISYRLAKRYRGFTEYELTAIDVLQGYKWTEEQSRFLYNELHRYAEDTAPNITYHSRPSGEKMSLESIMAALTATGEEYKAKGEPAPAVFIDYLHLITSEKAGTDPAALLKEATDSFKQYAINYNTFVILICATNRESNKKGDITLESGRDSSALEYTGDYVLSLQYAAIEDGIVNPDDKKDKKRLQELQRDKWRKMTMTVLKNRFGIQGRTVQMWFKPSTNIFYSKAAADFFDDPDIEAAEQKLRKWINEKKEAKEKKATNGGFKKTGEDWDELTGSKPKKA